MFKDYIKKYERNSVISSILMIILAILLILKPIKTLKVFIIIFGVIILIDGIINFINYFRSNSETKLFSFDLLEGLLEIVLSILIISNPESLITFLPIMLGIWVIIKNIIKIQISINLKQISNNWWILLILSILLVILGIILIINPFSATITLSLITGSILLISEITNLIECIYILFKLK